MQISDPCVCWSVAGFVFLRLGLYDVGVHASKVLFWVFYLPFV